MVSNLQIISDLNEFEEDFLFLNKSISSLRKKYANKFVVIKGKDIKGSGDTIEEAISNAKKKGVDTEKAVIEFISRGEEALIL